MPVVDEFTVFTAPMSGGRLLIYIPGTPGLCLLEFVNLSNFLPDVMLFDFAWTWACPCPWTWT